MIIRITEIPPDGKKRYEGQEEPTILGLGGNERLIHAQAPIHYRLLVAMVSGHLIVQGQVWTEASFGCSRCARFFASEVRDDQFDRVLDVPGDRTSVDLTMDIRETILLHFPGYPVCSANCKGLCVQCGANLNVAPCGCRPPGDRRWCALDGWSPPGKTERQRRRS